MQRRIIWGVCAAAGVMAGGVGLASRGDRATSRPVAPPIPKVEMLGTEFKSWAEINHDPVRMADRLALLCVAPGPEHSQANPHDAGYVKSYVNPLGAAMMRKRAGAFPVGSQVVKEKHDQTPTGEISVYTMMTKREKGFNPKGGDWEYAVYDGKGELKEKGKIARCMSCHQEAKAKERDFIFAEYADQAFLKGK